MRAVQRDRLDRALARPPADARHPALAAGWTWAEIAMLAIGFCFWLVLVVFAAMLRRGRQLAAAGAGRRARSASTSSRPVTAASRRNVSETPTHPPDTRGQRARISSASTTASLCFSSRAA
jgi:hypothetical protein